MAQIKTILDGISKHADSQIERGAVASYIPELASVDPKQFGMSVVMANGQSFSVGDAATRFS
ncbi:MAG: glutaminase, partial [Cognatishimia sp.]|nr:glutaminase [Cognatishimia sp.]